MTDVQKLPSLEEDVYVTRPLYRWLALLAALLAWGFDGVEQNIYSIMSRQALLDLLQGPGGVVTVDVEKVLGFRFSLSIALWLWGAAVGGILFGRLGDRFGRARTLLLSVSTYAIFTGVSALSANSAQFLACRFFGALGLGGTWPLCVALVVETWPENRRAMLAGAIGAAANAGFMLAALYSRWMLTHGYDWRWIIGVGCFIALTSLPVILFVPEPTRWRRSRQRQERSSLADLFSPEYRRSTIVGSLLSTVALLGTWGSFLWLATYIDKITMGTPQEQTGKAIVAQWQSVGQIVGGFAGGLLAGWLGHKRSWVLLCVTAWGSVIALFGLSLHFGTHVIILAMIAGLFVSSFFGWLPKYLPELYPTRVRASGQGFSYNIGRVLAGCGVLSTGYLVHLFKGDYRLGAMIMASVYLLGTLVVFFAPDTGGRMRDE